MQCFYFYLTIENFLNFSGIVMFSVLICSTLILGVCLQNRLLWYTKANKKSASHGSSCFSFYIFQMIYILFCQWGRTRFVDLRSQSYPDSLADAMGIWNQSEAVRNHSSGWWRFSICRMINRIAVMNLLWKFCRLYAVFLFLLLLTERSVL